MFTIRHIRTMLTTSLGLTKSGVKWDGVDNFGSLGNNQETKTPSQLLDRAKELIQNIKDKDSYSFTDFFRINELKNITAQLGKANTDKRDIIMNDVAVALRDPNLSSDDRKRFESLQKEWASQYKETDATAVITAIPAVPKIESRSLPENAISRKNSTGIYTGVPEEQSPAPVEDRPIRKTESPREKAVERVKDSTSTLKDNISRLADLNNDDKIDSSLRDVVNEDVLKRALSRVTNGGDETKIKEVYKTVTGNDVSMPLSLDSVKEFQTKLRASLVMIQKLTGGNAGLYGLLKGELGVYAAEVKKLDPKPEVKLDELRGLTPQMQTLIGSLVTAGVLLVTGGVVMVGHSAEFTTAESVLQDLDQSTLGKAWEWVKDAFTGRRLALSFFQDKMSVGEYKDKVRDFAKEAITLDAKTDAKDIKNPDLQKLYPIAQKTATELGMGDNKDAIQKAAIQAYVQNLGVENAGSDWTAKIGLLFIGANRDSINPTVLATKYSKFNEIEQGLNRYKLSSAELISAGVKIEKIDSKYKHTIPDAVKFTGDDEPVIVVKPDGINLDASDKVYDFHFSDKDGKYILSVTERKNQPKIGTDGNIIPQGDIDGKQAVGNVKNLRDKKEYTEKSNKNVPQVLYDIVGHQSAFAVLAKFISKGDMDGAKKELSSLAQKYKGNKELSAYVAQLQKDFDKNATTWDMYMSGNKDTRAQENPAYNSVRTQAVIAAEGRLAQKSGFPKPSDESSFRVTGKYEGKQISEVIQGQELTSVQFMTPLDEKKSNSLHRVSVNDGSFQVSAKTAFVTEAGRKEQIVKGLLNSTHESRGIESQVKKLNDFLGKNGIGEKVAVSDYVKYLVSGDIVDLKVPGLKLQQGKDTKFLEARAKVAGNVCLNCTYAIGYPAFELTDGGRQAITPAGTMDATAQLNAMGTELGKSSIGINTIGAALRVSGSGKEQGGKPDGITKDGSGNQQANGVQGTSEV